MIVLLIIVNNEIYEIKKVNKYIINNVCYMYIRIKLIIFIN